MSQIDQSTIGSVAVGTILSAGGIVEELATTTVRSLEGFSGRKGFGRIDEKYNERWRIQKDGWY